MAKVLHEFSEWFWSETFWLPPNSSWAHIERARQAGNFCPRGTDLWVPIPIAIGLFLVRLLWERFIALPLGRYFKIREHPHTRAVPNDVLEKAFKSSGKILKNEDVLGLSKQVDWTPRQVERWWRRRKVLGKPTEMQRFRETSWRFTFYLCAFWYGIITLWNKPWFTDTTHFWYGFPTQHVTDEMYWYYMVELGFYLSLILSLVMDNKRKDFWEMIIHHIATITLMVFSWVDNFVRVGTMVLVIHDAVDYWLEGAKLANYCKKTKLCDALFVVFTLVWFITRICIYPMVILRSSLNEGHHYLIFFPAYWVYNFLLCVLQVLHIIWFYMILRMVYYYIVKGQVEKDDRSETEPESDSEDESIMAKQVNGSHPPEKKAVNGRTPVANGVETLRTD